MRRLCWGRSARAAVREEYGVFGLAAVGSHRRDLAAEGFCDVDVVVCFRVSAAVPVARWSGWQLRNRCQFHPAGHFLGALALAALSALPAWRMTWPAA